jgi:catechol 2,3-dioxygenase-like lactoylglutathione lyase family enzyme
VLHRLTTITIGVPDVASTAAYYEEFGLTPSGAGRFATADGGEQLRLVPAPQRRLLELGVGADDPDDLARIAAAFAGLAIAVERTPAALVAVDPGTGVRVVVSVAERIRQPGTAPSAANGPGRLDRVTRRADAIEREAPVKPRKLGHVVLGSTDLAATERFFIDGTGAHA